MKPLKTYDDEYFFKFKNKPVELKPFDPDTKVLANQYLSILNKELEHYAVKAVLTGSTQYEISGRGEIELVIYVKEDRAWPELIKYFTSHHKGVGNLDNAYARFNSVYLENNIEIILKRGYTAKVGIALENYLLTHPEELIRYQHLKNKFSKSKRDYYREKNRFFEVIIESIPE